MADEPRRSGRATKGQHKNLELAEPTPSKRKARAQAKAGKQTSTEPTPSVTNEDDEIIRCICGEYEEEEDVERDMICCDKCLAWQHNDCMGLNFPKGEEPAEYFCEQCKPGNHKELLEKINRGEKPWEDAARKRAQEAEERKARKKKGGKRGRKAARPSDVKSEVSEPPSASATATPVREHNPAPPRQKNFSIPVPPQQERTGNPKRKYEDQGDGKQPEPVSGISPNTFYGSSSPYAPLPQGPKQKLQRLSTGAPASPHEAKRSPTHSRKTSMTGSPATSTSGQKEMERRRSSETVAGPADHSMVARRNVANALAKLFTEQAATANQQGGFTIPADKTKEDVGNDLGLAIEHSMYKNMCGSRGEPSEAYRQQMRTILFNVRKNASLRDNLLVGRITPDEISTMSTQDMASKELQQKDAEIKREAEKQHIIIEEQGPRIRRTHKGEEFVEADSQIVGTESIFSTAPGRRDTASEIEPPSAASPRHRSPSDTHQPEFKQHQGSTGVSSHHSTDKPGDDKSRRRSSGFNIEDVWSSVRSPGAGAHHDQQFALPVSYREPPPITTNKVQDDAEIDNLLKDEEMESPPYSPKDVHYDGDVWRGNLTMEGVAQFSATARHVGGADLSGRIPWSQLAPRTLSIDGRIAIPAASNYLCGQRYSHSNDITVIAISPPDGANDIDEFNKLFNYFVDRKRYGVVGKHPISSVKDTYIIPVEAGPGNKPEFIGLLENDGVQDPTPERLLLVVFVVKTNNHSNNSSAHQTPQTSSSRTAPNPLVPNPNPSTTSTSISQPQSQTEYNPATASPGISQYDGSVQPPPLQQQSDSQQYVPPPPQPYPASQSPPSNSITGKVAANQVLGPLAASPAVDELLRKAPHASIEQLNVIAGILAQNPTAANDYQLLMNALLQATNGV